MKIPRIFLLFAGTFLIFPLFASAAELAAPGTPARKLQRGFLNIALSPIEISNEVMKLKKTDAALPSWFIGMINGSFKAVGRSGAGLYEIITSPVPLPSGYEPFLKPEFTWEYLEPAPKPSAS